MLCLRDVRYKTNKMWIFESEMIGKATQETFLEMIIGILNNKK